MAQYSLSDARQIFMQILSPFGEDVIVTKIQGEERISQNFLFIAELVSKKNNLSFEACVTKSVTLSITQTSITRYFNGVVCGFHQKMTHLAGTNDEFTVYEMHIVPALWFLTQNTNCRVFEAITYTEIIETLLKAYQIDVKFALSSQGKPTRDLCIQYNESDFSFINRLMEEEGVYYFFVHEKDRHVMVVTDLMDSWERVVEDPLDYIGPHETDERTLGVTEISLESQVVASAAAVSDFNFKMPEYDLYAQANGEGPGGLIYHYPGQYWNFNQKDGEYIAKMRLEKEQKNALKVKGKSYFCQLSPGSYFSLKNHPRADVNQRPWALESVKHFAELEENIRDLTAADLYRARPILYQNAFLALSKNVTYRPSFKTARPKISTQTATVIGKEDEEIWTDEYGRIHVKFHWDHEGSYNDNASCWVRVASLWTGDQWGIRFTPRIGQEVVVQFLESNPDHPLVTGSVYNKANMPPYLPDNPTVSTIKTNSSPGGEGSNEIRFEDKKQEEQLYIHAQRNMDTLVEADQTVTLTKGNQTVTLHEGNYTRVLEKGDESITLQAGNRATVVKGGDETHENEQNYAHTVKQNDSKKVEGNLSEEVAGNYTQKIQGNMSQEIAGNAEVKVGGNYQLQVQGNLQITVTGAITVATTQGYTLNASSRVAVTAGTEVSITSGATLSLVGSATAQLTGSGMCQITGGMVMINS